MSKKTKTTVRLEPGEAYVVAPVEEFEHVILTYKQLAEEAENSVDRDKWLGSATLFEEWVDQTYLGVPAEDEDEQWP